MAGRLTKVPAAIGQRTVGAVRRARERPYRRADGPPPAGFVPPRVCDDIRAWCAGAPGASYVPVLPAATVRRDPPQTTAAEVHPDFARYAAVETPEHALVGVDGGQLAENGLVLLPTGELVGDVVTSIREYRDGILRSEPAYTHPLPRARDLHGAWYPLLIGNWNNYYHWWHDIVMWLPVVLPHLPPDVRFIAPRGLRPFHLAMLEVVGIPSDRLVEYPGREVWRCERLYFHTPYAKPMLDLPEPMASFRTRVLDAFGVTPRPHRRLFLSRRLDHYWRVTNEDDVVAALERRGFEVCQPALLTFREQVEQFAEAAVILGTGTGLSNMLWGDPALAVVQLQDPGYPVAPLYTMADALGYRFWYLDVEPVENPGGALGRADLHVPLPALEALLDRVSG